jgi:hypothetical protein
VSDLSIDVGSAYPYLEDRVLSLFGKDSATTDWQMKMRRLVRTSAAESSHIQCIGMAKPIPIGELYQPTSLLRPGPDGKAERATVDDFIKTGTDVAIFAGPGWGKTTFLHWVYQNMVGSSDCVPLLFTLRRPGMCDQLEEFVGQLERGRHVRKKTPITLLVDGYDEINRTRQQHVSTSLEIFRSLGVGRFYLTCRDHYDILDLKLEHCRLSRFDESDAVRFIGAFSKAYGASVAPEKLLEELLDHNLSDFAFHPLMLALVCILKTGPNPAIPRRAIGLVRRAIDTLTFRWDEAKYIKRDSEVPLDGEERVRCLMRVAYDMDAPQASYMDIERSLSKHLELLQVKGIDKRVLLREITQWYGLIVPTQEDTWQFVHRTIHDFLAARYWVESGDFGRRLPDTWDIRAAYAVCLLPDGTDNIKRMLSAGTAAFPAFCECLYNTAPFHMQPVAEAVVDRTKRTGYTFQHKDTATHVTTTEDFYSMATDDFLRTLVEVGTNSGDQTAGASVAFMALSELFRRGLRASPQIIHKTSRSLLEAQPDRRIEVMRQRRIATTDGAIVTFALRDAITNG